jgi:hypothetical protein
VFIFCARPLLEKADELAKKAIDGEAVEKRSSELLAGVSAISAEFEKAKPSLPCSNGVGEKLPLLSGFQDACAVLGALNNSEAAKIKVALEGKAEIMMDIASKFYDATTVHDLALWADGLCKTTSSIGFAAPAPEKVNSLLVSGPEVCHFVTLQLFGYSSDASMNIDACYSYLISLFVSDSVIIWDYCAGRLFRYLRSVVDSDISDKVFAAFEVIKEKTGTSASATAEQQRNSAHDLWVGLQCLGDLATDGKTGFFVKLYLALGKLRTRLEEAVDNSAKDCLTQLATGANFKQEVDKQLAAVSTPGVLKWIQTLRHVEELVSRASSLSASGRDALDGKTIMKQYGDVAATAFSMDLQFLAQFKGKDKNVQDVIDAFRGNLIQFKDKLEKDLREVSLCHEKYKLQSRS